MSLTFRKSVQIIPGVKLNLGLKSASVTVGSKKGPKITRSTTGRTTASTRLFGGLGWRKTFKNK